MEYLNASPNISNKLWQKAKVAGIQSILYFDLSNNYSLQLFRTVRFFHSLKTSIQSIFHLKTIKLMILSWKTIRADIIY